jgi:hypothetical protein
MACLSQRRRLRTLSQGCIVAAMSSTSLYVKLDPLSFERLRKRSVDDRRTMGDQAAILLRNVLEALEQQPTEQRDAVAA